MYKRQFHYQTNSYIPSIAGAIGIIFKTEITDFVNETFKNLDASKF